MKEVVAAAIDRFSPLCDIVAAETMVDQTEDGKLGDESPVVETMMGIDEFLEGVTTFISIAV